MSSSLRKIKIAVIPAGGKGTRISDLPLTKILPKAMLPILNKTILEHTIDKLLPLGVETIYLVLGHKNRIIREYFGDGSDFGISIKYVIERTTVRRGIGAAIYKTRKYINEPFIVVLGDDFTITKSMNNLVEDFYEKKAYAVTGVVKENNIESLKRTNCVHLGQDGQVIKMIEKPEVPSTNIRGCGVYVFDPIVFSYINKTPLSKRGLKDITDTLDIMSQEKRVYASFIDGINININTLDDLQLAMKETFRILQ